MYLVTGTSFKSPELLKVHWKVTKGGFASSSQRRATVSCFNAPWSSSRSSWHVGTSDDEEKYEQVLITVEWAEQKGRRKGDRGGWGRGRKSEGEKPFNFGYDVENRGEIKTVSGFRFPIAHFSPFPLRNIFSRQIRSTLLALFIVSRKGPSYLILLSKVDFSPRTNLVSWTLKVSWTWWRKRFFAQTFNDKLFSIV